MSAPPANPIAERLIHADRGPGPRASRVIGYGLGGAAGVTLGLALMVVRTSMAMAGLLAMPPAEVLLLAACFALAALMMAGYRRADDHALLRLTRLPPEAIFDGYVQGIAYRLRIVRAAAVGLLAGWGLAVIYWIVWYLPRAVPSIAGALAVLAILLALGVVYINAARGLIDGLAGVMVAAGVWLALRHPRSVEALAGANVLLALASIAITVLTLSNLTVFACCIAPAWLAALAYLNARRAAFRAEAVAAVEADLGEEDAA